MRPAWPEILRTALIGTAQGLFIAALAVEMLRAPPRRFIVLSCGVSLLLLAGGLCAAFFDPGRPRRAAIVLTPLNFVLLGTASGFTLAVPLAVFTFPPFAGVLALAAFSIGAAAYLLRCVALLRNARLRPKSTPAGIALALRWTFLALAFPVPAWLLGWGGGSVEAYIAAFALQFAGLLAERWYHGVIDLARHATR